jgi:hypothetical protein
MYSCGHCCRPKKCMRHCVGEFVRKFRVYKTCCFDVVAVCHHCGCEFEHHLHHRCPACGGHKHEPPRHGGMGSMGMGYGMGSMGMGYGMDSMGMGYGMGMGRRFEEDDEEMM